MTKLAWGAAGNRYFETGADRGVLYLAGIPGVPWNGLVSVNEAPVGGAPTPYYFDGFKYLQVSAAEEYSATIDAFSAPEEFAACDGTQSLANGLFVTQQPRKQFNFSYRTIVGNDLEGTEHGYRLHLVYNAMAAPSQISNVSMGDSADPTLFSWDISTVPVEIPGVKATSHLIIDSRKSNRIMLGLLESILYGTAEHLPRVPSITELLAIFGWAVEDRPIFVNIIGDAANTKTSTRNLATNPSFVGTTTTVEVRRNHAINPPGAVPSAGQFGVSPQWYGANGAAGTTTTVTGITDGPTAKITDYRRKTWTTQGSTASQDVAFGFSAGSPGAATSLPQVVAGQVWTLSYYWRTNSALAPTVNNIRVQFFTEAGAQVGADVDTTTAPAPGAGNWQRLSVTVTVPSTATRMWVFHVLMFGVALPVTTIIDGGGMLVEQSLILEEWFKGDNAAEGDFTYAFVGTANASASVQRAPNATTFTPDAAQGIGYQTSSLPYTGGKAGRLKIIAAPTTAVAVPSGVPNQSAGTISTLIMVVRANNRNQSVTPRLRGTTGTPVVLQQGVWTEVRFTGVTGSGQILTTGLIMNANSGHQPGDTIDVDMVTLVNVPSVGQPYLGPPFDANAPVLFGTQNALTTWVGTPNASASDVSVFDALNVIGNVGDAYFIDDDLWVFTDRRYWEMFADVPV